MSLIHHVVTGNGPRPIVFVHGFSCALSDWDAQVAYFSPHHRTVAVDLPGHGQSPAEPRECSMERYGADVAEVMRALDLPPAILVGHSMGCRVVTEAALQAPERTAGLILVDGSQFAPAMEATLRARFAEPDGHRTLAASMFTEMFTAKSDPAVVEAVRERALAMPGDVAGKVLLDLWRYDVHRFEGSLAALRVPVMAIQTTYSNEKRERRSLADGQTTPFLEMLRSRVPAALVEIIPDTGHFPQLDEAARTNEIMESFLRNIS